MRGKVIGDDDYDPAYCVDLGEFGVLDPTAPFRYLNHSCEPNCELVAWETEELPEIWVHVLRTIRPGDQLTIDYAWHAEAAIPCLCGSPNCRGYVVDANQMHKVKRGKRR